MKLGMLYRSLEECSGSIWTSVRFASCSSRRKRETRMAVILQTVLFVS